MSLPETAYTLCAHCNKPIEHAQSGTALRELKGWHEPRTQGGTNHLRFREETGRLMHGACADLKEAGGQGGLFE